jgi:hypothetical protein
MKYLSMLASKAPGVASFIPCPKLIAQQAKTRYLFLCGYHNVWICSEAWLGGELEE